jgi:hypothetical protein
MKSNQHSLFVDVYARCLQGASAVELPSGMENFGANEKALFEEIMLAWSQSNPLTVQLAMGIAKLGSPATLHKRVSRLRAMRLIDVMGVDGNRRTKYLIPSNKGLNYADSVGQAYSQSFPTLAEYSATTQ